LLEFTCSARDSFFGGKLTTHDEDQPAVNPRFC